MRVGIVVDHPLRDLAGAAKLAFALAQRGADAFLIPLYQQGIDTPLLGLDALIVNFARQANYEFVKACSDSGIAVYVLDTEGGVLTETGANAPAKLAAYVRDSGFNAVLSGYFFWGKRLHDAFLEQSVFSSDRLWITGCPRFDFTRPPWSALLGYHLSGYVLVNANFPLINPLFVQSRQAERDALVKAGWDGPYVDRLVLDLQSTFAKYLEAVEAVARRMPLRTFLVRPHPFESPEPYLRRFSSLSNVVVERRGSVLNVIQQSTCLLHLNCGTAVESQMLGRLPISLEFLNTPLLLKHTPLPSQVSYRAGDLDAVCNAIENSSSVLNATNAPELYQTWIYPWFHANDGRAADRIADAILGHRSGKPGMHISLRTSLRAGKTSATALQRSQALLANITGSMFVSRARAALVPARASKYFSPADVRAVTIGLAQHAKASAPAVASSLHPVTGFPLATTVVTPNRT